MRRTRKVFLASAMAAAALACSGVSTAAAAEFHSQYIGAYMQTEVKPVKFKVQGNDFECAGVVWGTTAGQTYPTQPMDTWFEKSCSSFSINTTIEAPGCRLLFNAANSMGLEGCKEGIRLSVKNIFFDCLVEIPNQTGAEGVTYTNTPPLKRELIVSANATFSANVLVAKGLCPMSVKNGVPATFTAEYKLRPEIGQFWVE